MHERRSLLETWRQGPRPDHAQVAHVVAIDLIQRTVAPSVERPPPHEPVGRIGILQHLVRYRGEATARLRRCLARRHHETHYDCPTDRKTYGLHAPLYTRACGGVNRPASSIGRQRSRATARAGGASAYGAWAHGCGVVVHRMARQPVARGAPAACGRRTSGTMPRGCLRVWWHGSAAFCSGCRRRRIRAAPTHPASGCIP